MRFSPAQRRALEALDEYIRGSAICSSCSDAGFFRNVGHGRKVYEGPVVSGDEAYFLRTDHGFDLRPDQVDGWERYKQLVIAHRLRTITIKAIAEDVALGLVFWPDLHAETPHLCNSVRRAVGLGDFAQAV